VLAVKVKLQQQLTLAALPCPQLSWINQLEQ
jgi:hypothetical protein